jgi:nitrilase
MELKGWKIGLSICYDLRFSELFLTYAKQAVDLILVPSAFLVPTGRAHWHVLLRARAIEAQAYVLAAAQGGKHISGKAQRETFGHTLAVGPWGEVISELEEAPGHIIIELRPESITKVREQIPMDGHRRL